MNTCRILDSSRAILFVKILKHTCIEEKVCGVGMRAGKCSSTDSAGIDNRPVNGRMLLSKIVFGWPPLLFAFVTVSSLIQSCSSRIEHGCLLYNISKTNDCPFTKSREKVDLAHTHTHTHIHTYTRGTLQEL